MQQFHINLPAYSRGFHIITEAILDQISHLPQTGLFHLFIQHTSAGICINENADPSVLADLNAWFSKNVKEDEPYYEHTFEGPDDMPAHIKTILTGCELTIPITNGRLNLGTWQGIYLGEFRNRGGSRKLIATVYS
jgi:secondary thiamine-phosphate synthase enzyme